ncbi:MAG: Nramp family divalent metal transporter [Cyclobacteriaceae bacterium]|nr:Nramp family divalent metal transporter [Cyclobacteriaceae bacterium]
MTKSSKGPFHKIALILAAVGPGLFLIGYNIGTGSVTTMAKAGAKYGMSLFWALLLSVIFTYILMVAYGQLTLVSGQTALRNFRQHFKIGKVLALYVIIALVAGELMAVMGVMGIVTDLLQEGIRLAFGSTISAFWITLVIVLGLYALLWHGQYKAFEKLLTAFVIIMGLCFVVVFFMVKPEFGAIAQGLIPSIPDEPGSLQLVAAMAGTTCSAAVFIVRSTVVAEKGWTIKDLSAEKRDSLVSASMMLFLSAIIMAVAAGTLNVMGLELTNTIEMISLFEPIGGKIAAFVLILGIAGAGLSTVFPIILIAPWLICDYTGRERNVRSPLFRILGLIGILFGFGLLILDERPPAMMIFSQAFQALILPAVAIPALILLNNEKIMGKYKAGLWTNVGLWAVIIFSLITSWFAIIDML